MGAQAAQSPVDAPSEALFTGKNNASCDKACTGQVYHMSCMFAVKVLKAFMCAKPLSRASDNDCRDTRPRAE